MAYEQSTNLVIRYHDLFGGYTHPVTIATFNEIATGVFHKARCIDGITVETFDDYWWENMAGDAYKKSDHDIWDWIREVAVKKVIDHLDYFSLYLVEDINVTGDAMILKMYELPF